MPGTSIRPNLNASHTGGLSAPLWRSQSLHLDPPICRWACWARLLRKVPTPWPSFPSSGSVPYVEWAGVDLKPRRTDFLTPSPYVVEKNGGDPRRIFRHRRGGASILPLGRFIGRAEGSPIPRVPRYAAIAVERIPQFSLLPSARRWFIWASPYWLRRSDIGGRRARVRRLFARFSRAIMRYAVTASLLRFPLRF